MSSHREAPEISKDPVADNADLYAFVSPDHPDTVTIISNFVPLQGPAGAPNFYEFGDDVLYEIKIDNDADARAEVTYQFRFTTELRNTETFLYNTGPISSLDSPSWNRRQFYSVTRIDANGHATVLGSHLASPPCHVGPRSTPDYPTLAQAAIHHLGNGVTVFAGQRRDGFYVDLGAIFDLGDLRPFQNLHLIPTAASAGVDALKDLNIHSIAIQVPKTHLTSNGSNPKDPKDSHSVIGVWSTASRRKVRVRDRARGTDVESGPWVQVSRLGNPLINEVIIPMGDKDRWNALAPKDDAEFVKYYNHPELAKLLPILYPNVFPHLAGLTAARADLDAILLTGIPSGIIKGFQNFTGKTPADMLRLNLAILPASKPSLLGILGGDLAGFPNGRRVYDNVVAIELRAVAGATYPLVNPSYKADGAAALLTDGTSPGSDRYLTGFPYLGTPKGGYETPRT